MLPILIILFTVIPAIELYLFILIGGEIGALNTVGVIIISGIVGAWLAKIQGLHVIWSIQRQLQRGKAPAKEMVDGLIVIIGAVFLITPGFLTDVLGLAMIMPGSRRLFGNIVKFMIFRALSKGSFKGSFHVFSQDERQAPSSHQQDFIEAQYEKKTDNNNA